MTDKGREVIERSRPAAAVLNLVDVRASRLEAELLAGGLQPPYDVEVNGSGRYGIDGGRVGIDLLYDIAAKHSKTGVDVWRASVVLHLEYVTADGQQPPASEAVEAYASTAAPFMAHPYAREVVHNITARLGVPPFLLPVIRSGPATTP